MRAADSATMNAVRMQFSRIAAGCLSGVRKSPFYIAVVAALEGKTLIAMEVSYAPMIFIGASSSTMLFLKSPGLVRTMAVYVPLFCSLLSDGCWVSIANCWHKCGLNMAMLAVFSAVRRSRALWAVLAALLAILITLLINAEAEVLSVNNLAILSNIWNFTLALKHRVAEALLGAARQEIFEIGSSILERPDFDYTTYTQVSSQLERIRYLLRLDEMRDEPASELLSQFPNPDVAEGITMPLDTVDRDFNRLVQNSIDFFETSEDSCEESQPLLAESSSVASVPDWSADRVECVICMDRHAQSQMTTCGHTVACISCRRSLVFTKLVCSALCPRTATARRNLSRHTLNNVVLPCPLCRTEGCLLLTD